MKGTHSNTRIQFWDHIIGATLAFVFIVWLLSTAHNLGFARDEGFYFRAASTYARWFQLLFTDPASASSQTTIDSIWATNHEHPALMKSLFALSWIYLHQKWQIFQEASTAFRFPAMVMAGIALWVIYLFGARAYSRCAGFVAALLFMLMPRVFYQSHLACFDIPVVTMWTLTLYVYWRSQQEKTLVWALATGLVYGLTLETKHNAWILPAVIIPHAFFVHRKQIVANLHTGRFPIPTSLLAMATLGPYIFYKLWPWLWNDTLPRIQEYVKFHLYHEYYNMEFLGKNYWGPPSPKLYAPVMILATVPTITLLLFLIGSITQARVHLKRVQSWFSKQSTTTVSSTLAEPDLLFALAFGAALGPFFLSKTPIFGGTKHWMPAYPFLALFAGRGFDHIAQKLSEIVPTKKKLPQLAAQFAFGLSVVFGPFVFTLHSHPVGLSSYVPIVGGASGAASLGLNRQFWGFTTQNVASYLNANTPRNASIYIHDTAWDSWYRMTDEFRVRPDLHPVAYQSDAQIALTHHELHMSEVDHQTWVAFGSAIPAYVYTHDGVPIVSVYKKEANKTNQIEQVKP